MADDAKAGPDHLARFLSRRVGAKETKSGMSTEEVASKLGVGLGKVREWLRNLSMQNRLEVGWRRGRRIDGKAMQVPCYRLTNQD